MRRRPSPSRPARSLLALGLAAGLVTTAASPADAAPPSTTRALSKGETSLLAQIPGGNHVLFGGNYLRFQRWLEGSPLKQLLDQAMNAAQPGMKAWMDCFVALPNTQMVGGFRFADGQFIMRFAMRGVDLAAIERCGKAAGFPTRIDADRRYLAIDMPNTAPGAGTGSVMTTGYLVLPSGALYMRQAMALGGTPVYADRAALEADTRGVKAQNATRDRVLLAEARKVDRTRAVWFVASAAGTPAADKLGTLRGWMDIDPGMSFDVSLELKDGKMVEEVADAIPTLKLQAGQLGPAIGDVAQALAFEREGNRLRFALAVTDAQLAALFAQLAPFMKAATGGP